MGGLLKQEQLNQEMIDLGRDRYLSKINKAKSMGLETTIPSGQKLLSECSMKMADELVRWMKKASTQPGRRHRALPYLAKLPTRVTGGIVCQVILDSISQQKTLVSTAMSVARYLEDEIKFRDLKENQPRLLAVDNAVYVPVNKVVKVMITANDVLHAWALPSFGVKRDAVPGRINETWFKAEKVGTYYGQCSELCGIKHAFMPIAVKVVSEY